MSLVIRMRFIFGDDGNDAPCLSRFFDFRAFSHAFYSIQKLIVERKKLDSPKGENNGLLTLDCEQSLVSLLGYSRSTTLKSEKMTAFKAVVSPLRVRLSLRLTTRSSPGLFQAPGYSDPRNWESAITKIKREETAEPRPRFSQITRSYFRVRFIYASSLISESLEQATAPPNEELVNPLPPRTVLGVRSQTLRYTSTTHSPQLKVWSVGGNLGKAVFMNMYCWLHANSKQKLTRIRESVQYLLVMIVVVSCCWKYANVPKSSSLFKINGPDETAFLIFWNSWIKVKEQ